MKFCPKCNAQYGYEMSFCLEDGTPLQIQSPNDDKNVSDAPQVSTVNSISEAEKPLFIPQTSLPKTNTSSENISEETISFANSPFQRLPIQKSETRKSKTGLLIGLTVAAFLLIGTVIGAVIYLQNTSSKDIAAANSFNGNTAISIKTANSDGGVNVNSSQVYSKDSGIDTQNSTPLEKTNSRVNTAAKKTPEALSASNNKQTVEADNTEPVKTATPTPVPVKPTPQLNASTSVSGGIPNRKTISLVKPSYPPAARAVRASGRVDVQVTIDESGEVVAAYAISGHPSLRLSSEQAARASKFSPTPTKGNTTGNIVYNYTPQ